MYVLDSHMCTSLTLVYKYKGNDIWVLDRSTNISNNIFSTMSHIPKRFKGTVAGKLYSSKKGKIVKEYLEEKGLEEWAKKTKGVDDKGAEEVVVVLVMDLDFIASVSRSHTLHRAAGHEGGTVPTEPFHLGVHVKDAKGHPIKTENPHTKKQTETWHAYIGKSKDDLYNISEAWHKSKGGK